MTKSLSLQALKVIEEYLTLSILGKNIPCPYYNNRRARMRGSLRVLIGKGKAEEIIEEISLMCVKDKIGLKYLPEEEIKKCLIDHKLGIDCSGLAYYILDAENRARGLGALKQKLSFPFARPLTGGLIRALRPIENTGVRSLSHEKNSREIDWHKAEPGDMLIMLKTGADKTYNHIMVVYETETEGDILHTIKYIHSFAWPSDGKYGHGVRKGEILIINPEAPLRDQRWIEKEKIGKDNFTEEKAKEAEYFSIRRLNWF